MYKIATLSTEHDRESFDCGEPSLNDFLKRFARQNDEKGLGRTFVAVLRDSRKIHGYYTIAAGSVKFDNIPEKLPRYPIPVAHLGRLTIDNGVKGQGLGKALLIDALRRIENISEQLGIYAVEIYALNDPAKKFYLKFGFSELADDRFHLYLSVKTIRKLFL